MTYEGMSPAECIRRFDAKQGGNGIHVDGWVLFPNGAMRENAAWGPLVDPPKDPWERAKRVVRYHEERLRGARVQFNEYKQGLLQGARANLRQTQTPPPPTAQSDAVRKLEELQAEVGVCNRACVEARKQLKAAKPAWMVQREEAAAANRSANEEFLNAISGINT